MNKAYDSIHSQYDSSGVLRSREETRTDGSTYYTYTRHEDGTSDALTYDQGGHVMQEIITQADGSKEIKDFLIANKPYDSEDRFYDDHGALTSLTKFDGTDKYYSTTISGGTTTVDTYSSGELLQETITQTDGSKEVKNFLIANKPYDSDDRLYDDHGALISLTKFDGTDKYYSTSISGGTTTVDNYIGGELSQETITQADGSKEVKNFLIANKPYDSDDRLYDDHGALTSLTQYHGDDKYYSKSISNGTTTVDNYDQSGNLIQETVTHPDTSRDVSKFGIVNPVYHATYASYDASNTLIEADYANNDNTRSVLVKAAGVSVESTSSPDIFTSFGNDDTFVFHANSGNDTISHFKAGSAAGDDTIVIDGGAVPPELTYTSINNGRDTLITLDADDTITVKNAHVDDVKADVFLLAFVHI